MTDGILISPDPDDPEDGAVTADGLERGLIGRRLRMLRARVGLDVEAFAVRYGIPAEAVRGYEASRSPITPEVRSYLAVIVQEPEMTAAALRRAAA